MTTATIVLTEDQTNALNAFHQFLLDPIEQVFVLSGYSGCGKSTLVRTILDEIPNFMRAARLINPKQKHFDVELTATTNKAAENLAHITGHPTGTIHSFLGLRVNTDFRTGVTTLSPRRGAAIVEDTLIFIDEASYVDKQLLQLIFSLTRNCKICFIGDPAQLTPVKATSTPVFDAHFNGAMLSKVVRQAEGNPIVDLSTKFRHTVNTGEFFSFTPDGQSVIYLERDKFNEAIEAEFTRHDWKYQDSKVLAWTNKCVIGYNHFINNHVTGDPHFAVGDYAVVNSFITTRDNVTFKTDQLAQITAISTDYDVHGVTGKMYSLDHVGSAFMPNHLSDKNKLLRQAKSQQDFNLVAEVESTWIDLRAAYACTINKAQGSTFDRVFIDLDDIRRCNSGDQIARMLYVGVSRARHQVFLTGDLVA